MHVQTSVTVELLLVNMAKWMTHNVQMNAQDFLAPHVVDPTPTQLLITVSDVLHIQLRFFLLLFCFDSYSSYLLQKNLFSLP